MNGSCRVPDSRRSGLGGASFEHPWGWLMAMGVGDVLEQHGWEMAKVRLKWAVEWRDIPDVIEERGSTEFEQNVADEMHS